MQKTLKFAAELVPLILSGEKIATWRLFDDKNLSAGDNLLLVNAKTGELFGEANIRSVIEKSLGELTVEDWEGHERFANDAEMYATYESYYKRPIGPETVVGIVRFKLL